MVSLCVVGGTVEPDKVGSVSSSGVVVAASVEVAIVEAVVGSTGAEVGAAWVVMVIGAVVVAVETSVLGFGANVLRLPAVLPGMVGVCSVSFRLEVSIMVVGVFLVVNAVSISFVTVFSGGWLVFIEVLVVSSVVKFGETLAGLVIKGIGHFVFPEMID